MAEQKRRQCGGFAVINCMQNNGRFYYRNKKKNTVEGLIFIKKNVFVVESTRLTVSVSLKRISCAKRWNSVDCKALWCKYL